LIGGKRRSPLATRKTCLDIVVSPSTDCRLAITKVNRWRQAQVFCHIVESFHNKKVSMAGIGAACSGAGSEGFLDQRFSNRGIAVRARQDT
jgi:hypothetical protein